MLSDNPGPKRRGRPPSDQSATATLLVRLRPETLEAIRERAEVAGMTVSTYVRTRCLAGE